MPKASEKIILLAIYLTLFLQLSQTIKSQRLFINPALANLRPASIINKHVAQANFKAAWNRYINTADKNRNASVKLLRNGLIHFVSIDVQINEFGKVMSIEQPKATWILDSQFYKIFHASINQLEWSAAYLITHNKKRPVKSLYSVAFSIGKDQKLRIIIRDVKIGDEIFELIIPNALGKKGNQ